MTCSLPSLPIFTSLSKIFLMILHFTAFSVSKNDSKASIGPISGDKIIHDISRESRLAFGSLVKAFPFTITGLGGFSEAVITRGGVSVKDIQPGSMESKLIKNLYFIGEVLDLDAVTGGYNLQIAWSTAYLAATDVCRNKEEDI